MTFFTSLASFFPITVTESISTARSILSPPTVPAGISLMLPSSAFIGRAASPSINEKIPSGTSFFTTERSAIITGVSEKPSERRFPVSKSAFVKTAAPLLHSFTSKSLSSGEFRFKSFEKRVKTA